MSHLPGTVGRWQRKLGHLSLCQGRILPRFVFIISGAPTLHQALESGECSPSCPVGAVLSPVGTQSVREVGIMGAWAGWGVQEGSPRKEHHSFNNMDPTPRLLCAGLCTVCAGQSPGPCPTASRHWRPKEVVACPKGSWTDGRDKELNW